MTKDGGDTCGAWEESECFSDKRSDSGSVADSNSSFFLDRLNFADLFKSGGVNEELLVNQMGNRIQEYFLNESDNFMGMFAPSELPKRKVKKKKERQGNQEGFSGLSRGFFFLKKNSAEEH